MAQDPEILAHLEWLGFVQPVGLVVSIPALTQAQAYVNKNIIPDHQRFLACMPEDERADRRITDFPTFTRTVLGWEAADLLGTPDGGPVPDSLEVALPEYGETLKPTYAVREFDKGGNGTWLMLIQELRSGADLDKADESDDRRWQASPEARFERLLRETQVPVGLLVNGTHIRLVYAPRGETSGHVTFRVADMASVAGRPIFAALHMLLCAERLFTLPDKQRLPAILSDSRKYQNLVSTQLAEQVLAALFELLRGFQAADDSRKGDLLREALKDDPNEVYKGLLTVLMRLVFVLFAEDRNLLSNDPLYTNHYSVTGLFNRLRADAGRFPDTMDQRYGAWAQLLVLFRIIYDGAKADGFHIPGRKGYLFDPDRYPFLEGRLKSAPRPVHEPGKPLLPDVPRVSDGVIFRALQNLLILDGERLSYRTLDVEQIGSVYEAIMGFRLEIAGGRSIGIKPVKRHGAPATINLETLLDVKPADRGKWLKEQTDQKFDGKSGDGLKDAMTIDALLAALDKRIARHVTPSVVPKGAMVLQPSDERRRSGSHYTPRSLTEPIVRKTLEPILKRLGNKPTPEQLLDLKICDMACGSGAFMVEACRQLGDELVKAWHMHNRVPKIPPDEDEVLHARRVIAQRCLYGVDKNPMAVDLAKLSLWLATLAKDHPFTFLDHALRAGDSLVGLTRQQIADFHWDRTKEKRLGQEHIEERIKRATQARKEILDAGDSLRPEDKAQRLAVADEALDAVRFFGDLCTAAFFAGKNDRERKSKREEYLDRLTVYLQSGDMHQRPTTQADALRSGERPIVPFHWEIEFPEVFGRENPGFDAIVGNPPFFWGNRISTAYGEGYRDWLLDTNIESTGNADLVVYFLRRALAALRDLGTFGLIATNSIAETDTRAAGLDFLCDNGGFVFAATRDSEWPGDAGVRVAVIHLAKGRVTIPCELDGVKVVAISSDLRPLTDEGDPRTLQPQLLAANRSIAFKGVDFGGDGFVLTPAEVAAIETQYRRELRYVQPLLNAEDFVSISDDTVPRRIINFTGVDVDEARAAPFCLAIVEQRVRPMREKKTGSERTHWWQFRRTGEAYMQATAGFPRLLVGPVVAKHLAYRFYPPSAVFTNAVNIFAIQSFGGFAALQSQAHEWWARRFASTLESRLRYNPTDCFETFPFPEGFKTDPGLETPGTAYYEFRAALMVRKNEGLTKTYNRFHDPNVTSPDIARLRELHAAMDRAVLDAYGWTDIPTDCQFLLDYEDDEDEDDEGFSLASAAPGRKARTRKKPWRYRWPDEIRDEVLARLLALNAQRAEEERLAGLTGTAKAKKGPRIKKTSSKTDEDSAEPDGSLFADGP
ncbi:MAG: N-6 DNA methylase [Planctomycetes bacterium]|nr:N-6 DNA methylase [Planctomycetota bacterium]